MELITAIKVMMIARNETYKDLAQAIGMRQGTLSNKLQGRNRLSISDLRAIMKHFEVTPDEFYSIFFAE